MFILIFQVVIAGLLSYFSSKLFWFLPLIVFPALLKLFMHCKSRFDPVYHDLFFFRPRNNEQKQALENNTYYVIFDFLIYLLHIGWIIFSAVICYKNFSAWWGIPIGIFIGFVGDVVLTPRRWFFERNIPL